MVRLVNEGMAILSLRESDFDAYSAYGEVVDNAIQAEASEVKVHMEYSSKGRHEPIEYIAFGDNGHGMDEKILHRCLQLGYSSRYNDRSGIGRFGVGATLAAINQCQRVEVYSKQKGGNWLYTYADIQEITKSDEQEITEPITKAPSKKLAQLAGDDSGTIVLWSKYDRQPDNANLMINEAKIWMGRTYRKFIWDGLEIFFNNEFVHAIDPLYLCTENTRFPDDPKATKHETMSIPWAVPKLDRQTTSKAESVIEIRMSTLPQEFRPKKGAGKSPENVKRFVDRNEGISILRNGREVFYGHIPYWPGAKFEEIDRYWGCEISFDAILDREFTVKNIKRGAVPVTELKKALNDHIRPTRITVLDEVRDHWKANAAKKEVTEAGKVKTKHEVAERIAKKTPAPISQIDKKKNLAEETDKFVDEWIEDAEAQAKAAWKAKFESQPFTIVDKDWKGNHFMETSHLGGSSILEYNSRHLFHKELSEIRDDIEQGEVKTEHAERLKALIDILLMAYGKAEASFDPDMKMVAEKFLEQLRGNWGNYLTNYIDTWHDEEC